MPAALAALAAACLALAPSAGALLAHVPGGRIVSYQAVAPPQLFLAGLADPAFGNVQFNGGPVMTSNTNYAIYWRPEAAPAYPPDYEAGIDRYLGDLAHDSGGSQNVDSVAAQYGDADGRRAWYSSHFGGGLIDSSAYPASGCTAAPICLTDAQVQAELTRLLAAYKLPADVLHEYFLLTPPGVVTCLEAGSSRCSAPAPGAVLCSYHAYSLGSRGAMVYADVPFLAGTACDDGNHPNATTADATISGGLSHEHVESLADPQPDSGWADLAGGQSSGYEIGDKCRTFSRASEYGTPLGTAPNGALYNQVINGHLYWTQQEWSNTGRACLQRFAASASSPAARFTYSVAPGSTEVHFDASASTAPGGVARYSWQFNDPAGASAPVETTTPTIAHALPAAGAHTVALTVFAADGSSAGAARSITLGEEPGRVAPPDLGRCVASPVGEWGNSACTRAAPGFGSHEWLGAGSKSGFRVSLAPDTTVTLQVGASTKLACTSASGSGRWAADGRGAATVTLTLDGCAEGRVSCRTPGAREGEIVGAPLEGTLGVVSAGSTPLTERVGMALRPSGGVGPLTEFACAGVPAMVTGSAIATIAIAKPAASMAAHLTSSGDVQRPGAFVGGSPAALSVQAGAFEAAAGLSASLVIASETAVEVNPVA